MDIWEGDIQVEGGLRGMEQPSRFGAQEIVLSSGAQSTRKCRPEARGLSLHHAEAFGLTWQVVLSHRKVLNREKIRAVQTWGQSASQHHENICLPGGYEDDMCEDIL